MQCERFTASACWLDGFIARQGLSFRTPHPKRRAPINPEYASSFLDRLSQAKHEYGSENIFNFDETCWKRSLALNQVFAEKRDEAVKLKTVKGEKKSYTGYGCISAADRKLPFWMIAKGKTDLCHAKFKPPMM
jgi:hypothetical protein